VWLVGDEEVLETDRALRDGQVGFVDRFLASAQQPVPRQNSFTIAELVLRAPQAVLRYSLIRP
jgi:hypothetical protein